MSVMSMEAIGADYGGLVVSPGVGDGGLIERVGQIQFGPMLLGGGTSARWRTLTGWRDLPGYQASDSPRPQAHGVYPGAVYGDALVVTFDFLLRGRPDDKMAAIAALEQYAAMDGTEQCLAVHDGDGVWFRRARVIGRTIPQDIHFRTGPVECSLQFLCSDPRRYSVLPRTGTVTLPTSSGGLQYPLVYPLTYGEAATGGLRARNLGGVPTPLQITFVGPLTNPALVTLEWSLQFGITLADGETLVVDTAEGTALLNGETDRLYTIRNTSDPLERCLLKPGDTSLTLTADTGTGRLLVSYHDARM